MSTAASTSGPNRTLTLAQRRRAVLDRGGLLSSRRVAQKPANTTFFMIFLTVLTLVTFGLVMVMSSSSIVALNRGFSPWTMFFKQLMWASVGGLGMAFFFRFPYSLLRRFVFPALIFAFGLMFLPFAPNIGVSINGARAWVAMGPVGFQPSEFLKLALLVYCANLLGRRQKEVTNFNRTSRPVILALVASVALCLIQRDLGGAIVMTCIVLAVMCMAGIPMRIVNAIAGGVSGVGVGAGTGKWGYVPLAHSDFIFSTIAEEMGLIGAAVVIGGFLSLVVFGLRAALHAEERFGALLAGGVTMWFAIQAIINIGGVTGSMPVTGLTLPLISYGGSSLLVCMSAAGLLMNVARNMK
ncbi:MAG: cell division protein FtsW [Actinobacteria bacterium]|nr:cell division protein FtsW [Actinomycetota bacterium]